MKRPYSADSALPQDRTNYPQIPAILHNAQERPNNVAPQAFLPQMRQQPAHYPFTHHTGTDLPYFQQALNAAELNQYVLPAETSGYTSTLAMVIPPAPEKHTEPVLIIYNPNNPPAHLPSPWFADITPKIESYINDDKQAGAWLATCKRNYFANNPLREFRVFQRIKKELEDYKEKLEGDYKRLTQNEKEYLIVQKFYEQIIPSEKNFLISPLTTEVHNALKLGLLTTKLANNSASTCIINTFNESEFLNGLRGLVRWYSAKLPPPVIHKIEQEKNIDKISNYHTDGISCFDLRYSALKLIKHPENRIKVFDTLIKAFLWGSSIQNLYASGGGCGVNFFDDFIKEAEILSPSAMYRLGILTRSYNIIDERKPRRLNEMAAELKFNGWNSFDDILLKSKEALICLNKFKTIYRNLTNEARITLLTELINELLALDEKNVSEIKTNKLRYQSLIVEAALLAQLANQYVNTPEAISIILKVTQLIEQQLSYFSHLPENFEPQSVYVKEYERENFMALKTVISEILNPNNPIILPTDPLSMLTIPTIQTQALGEHTLFQVDQEHFYHLISTFHQLSNYLASMPANGITQPLHEALNNIALSWPDEIQRKVLLGWLPRRH